jgi:hypothetical protein
MYRRLAAGHGTSETATVPPSLNPSSLSPRKDEVTLQHFKSGPLTHSHTLDSCINTITKR